MLKIYVDSKISYDCICLSTLEELRYYITCRKEFTFDCIKVSSQKQACIEVVQYCLKNNLIIFTNNPIICKALEYYAREYEVKILFYSQNKLASFEKVFKKFIDALEILVFNSVEEAEEDEKS